MNDKQKAESYRRDLEKRSLQVVQLNKRIRELEAALSELVAWARDIAGDCECPNQRKQECEMIDRMDEALEPPR